MIDFFKESLKKKDKLLQISQPNRTKLQYCKIYLPPSSDKATIVWAGPDATVTAEMLICTNVKPERPVIAYVDLLLSKVSDVMSELLSFKIR
jgi:hypothetical protein